VLLDQLRGLARDLRSILSALEPERLSGTDADRLLQAFAELERLASAGKILAARRVETSNAWRRRGHRSAAAHVAEVTGTGLGQAVNSLVTARQLGSLPATEDALRKGRLSESQVKEIAGAASVRPEAERSLVDAAGSQPLNVLKLRCQRVKASGHDQMSSYHAMRRGRYLRNWTDGDGAFRVDARLTPDEGARLLARVKTETDRLVVEARRAGVEEPRRALAADALVRLVRGRTKDAEHVPSAPATMVHVRVDHAALVRGRVEPGEICEIPGVGPIPVAVARSLSADSILSVVVTDGVDVTGVAHAGRTIPAPLRRALIERDPVCAVPGCGQRDDLEIDHLEPLAQGGRTTLENLVRLCHWHHYLKTHQGHGLESVDGTWRWIVPGSERSPTPLCSG
jgi:hypothetical protein